MHQIGRSDPIAAFGSASKNAMTTVFLQSVSISNVDNSSELINGKTEKN